jgi:hypothetical protein
MESNFVSDLSDILDTEWINDFKKDDKIYNEFYKDNVEQIKLFFLYISSTNVLETIKKDSIFLDTGGVLKKDKIISLIKKNQIFNGIKYKLLSMLRFNIDIEPEEINDFVVVDGSSRFLTIEKYLNDIKYSDTISIFQDLNCLYFIFYEEKIKPTTISIHNNSTKKISINKYNKTRRIRITRKQDNYEVT